MKADRSLQRPCRSRQPGPSSAPHESSRSARRCFQAIYPFVKPIRPELPHGWGITFYEGRGCRSFHDPQPSATSDVARLIRAYPIKSRVVIAHVRRVNQGRVALENTHPFTRELWGRAWTFAHNGQLKGVKRWSLGTHRPIGTTDSEHAFCWLLGQLQARWRERPHARDLDTAIQDLCGRL